MIGATTDRRGEVTLLELTSSLISIDSDRDFTSITFLTAVRETKNPKNKLLVVLSNRFFPSLQVFCCCQCCVFVVENVLLLLLVNWFFTPHFSSNSREGNGRQF